MTYQKQEYEAPICTVLSFQIQENVNAGHPSRSEAESNVGSDASDESGDIDLP